MHSAGIDRIYLLEEDYRRAQATAEHDWLTRIIDQLREGTFTWRPDPHPWPEAPDT
jgi:hypothetical protein